MPSNEDIGHKGLEFRSSADAPEKPKGNNYLLAISIDKYTHARKLNNCVRDAENLIHILTSKYDFEKEKNGKSLIYTLFNEQATRKNILKSLRSIKSQITPDDNFVLYFSGHGEIEGDKGFWIPFDAKPDEFDEFVSTSDIKDRLDAIHSFHTFLLVDACFAGSLFSTFRSVSKGYETKPSRWGIAASHSKEVALDGHVGGNSPFSERLIRLLKDNNGPLGVQKLCADLVDEVQRITERKQTPVFQPLNVKGHELGQYVFHLKKDEAADWKMALAENTIGAYEGYLAIYPQGKYKDSARNRIRELSAGELWQKIRVAGDTHLAEIDNKILLIEQFIQRFKGDTHYKAALDEGDKLVWKKKFLKARENKFALLKFRDDNPPYFREEAEKIIQDLEEKEESRNRHRLEEEKRKARQERLNQELAQKETKLQEIDNEPVHVEQQERISLFRKVWFWPLAIILIVSSIFGIRQLSQKDNRPDGAHKSNEEKKIKAEVISDPNLPPKVTTVLVGDTLKITMKHGKKPYTLSVNGPEGGIGFFDLNKEHKDYNVFSSRKYPGLYLVIMGDANKAKDTAKVQINPFPRNSTLLIGDSYKGGIVAYFLQPGDRGFEPKTDHGILAHPTDNGTGSWNEAVSICQKLTSGGRNDWFLPSSDEFESMADSWNIIGGFNPDEFYWTRDARGKDKAESADLYTGPQRPNFRIATTTIGTREKNEIGRCRCVSTF